MDTYVDLKSGRWGTYDQIFTGRVFKLTGTPTQFTAAALAKLYTHAAVRMGGSIVGATDKPVIVHTVDGKKRTCACAFIYQEPAINCLTGKTILGEVVIYAIVPLTGGADNMDNFYDEGTAAWSDADWNPEDEITPGWDFSWPLGEASDWDDIDTKDNGIILTPKSGLTEDISNRDGLKNVTINDYGVDAKAKVMNISETLFLDALGRNLKPGQRRSSLGRDLKLNANDGTAFIRAHNAVLQPTSLQYNAEGHVVSDLAWKTFPLVTAGVRGPHLLVTTEDPDAEA